MQMLGCALGFVFFFGGTGTEEEEVMHTWFHVEAVRFL